MHRKIILTLVLVILAGLMVWLNTGDDRSSPDRELAYGEVRGAGEPVSGRGSGPRADLTDESTTRGGTGALSRKPGLSNEASPEQRPASPTIPEPTHYEVDDLLRWYEERGQILGASDYQGYSLETLSALAEQGDIYALQLVAEQLREEGLDEPANAYLFEAAARGSVHAIERLGRAHYLNVVRARNDGDAVAEKHSVMEALAWYETAYLRGDLNSRSRVDGLMENLGELELTEEDLHSVQQKAQAHYRQLEGHRLQLGFPDFDNTPHPVLKKYFDMYEAQSPRD
jgi:hypothetical protein